MTCAKSVGEKSSRLHCGRWIWYEPLLIAVSKFLFLSFSPAMFNVRSIIPVDHPLIFFLSEETKLYRLGRHGPSNERALALTVGGMKSLGIAGYLPVKIHRT